jgi:phosphoribosylformimino-5-aminoimidazole carboxamide ribotide isomerase
LPSRPLKLHRGGCSSAAVVHLLPAIDIRNGRVVRLSQGEATRQTVYADDPLLVAEQFIQQGAQWLHVVDLDRAFGSGTNFEVIKGLVGQIGARARVQLGGGLRQLDLIRAGLELGVSRAVIGTAAAMDAGFIPAAIREFGSERLAVGIDVRQGQVALRGWTETSSRPAADLAQQVVAAGIRILVYTDIGRDGMLSGPDLAGAVALQSCGADVIASGGVAGTADIRAACLAGLAGLIVGRALYEGRLTLTQALEAARCSNIR